MVFVNSFIPEVMILLFFYLTLVLCDPHIFYFSVLLIFALLFSHCFSDPECPRDWVKTFCIQGLQFNLSGTSVAVSSVNAVWVQVVHEILT